MFEVTYQKENFVISKKVIKAKTSREAEDIFYLNNPDIKSIVFVREKY